MRIIQLFDPWKGKLCTCPPKYSFSPYTGCSHSCVYCYASSYIPHFFKPRVKRDVLKRLIHDISTIDVSIPVSMSNSSDPYQHLEKRLKITRSCLKVFKRAKIKLLVVTKSDLVLRDVDILKTMNASVSITITTLNRSIAKLLEPHAPEPAKRIKAAKNLISNGIPVSVRIDPIIPGLNDDVEELIKTLADIGVQHIVSSTYKVRPDNWKRFSIRFPSISKNLQKLYFDEGEQISNYRYLPTKLRFELMKKIRDICDSYGISFATCREGFTHLHTSKTCDGSHLIPDE